MVLKSRKTSLTGIKKIVLSIRKSMNNFFEFTNEQVKLRYYFNKISTKHLGGLGRGDEGYNSVSNEQLDRLRSTVISGKDHKYQKASIKQAILNGVTTLCRVICENIISEVEMLSIMIAILLILGTIEINPGPHPKATSLSILTFNCNGLGNNK